GVLVGAGSNNVGVTAAGTSGQILIASTTGDPRFSTITSSGGTVTFSVGPNSLNIEVNARNFTFTTPWTVPLGGTGRTVLTSFGVLVGAGSNNVGVTAAGTSGQILIASTTGDPRFSTITSSGGTVTFSVGPNSLNIEVNARNFTFTTPWTVPLGGTGRTVLTTFGVLVGAGSNNVGVTAAGTSGQILIASTTGDPKFSIITSSGGTLTFTRGPNSLNIEIDAPVDIPFGGTNTTTFGSTVSSVIYFNGTSLVGLNPGSSGQVLVSQGAGVAPSFGFWLANFPITFVASTPYTVTSTDYFLSVSTSSAAITITLPDSTSTGRVFVIKDRTGNAATNNITIQAVNPGSVTIDGFNNYKLNTRYESVNVIFDGSNYEIF
ncbi:MAG: hypothetical protein Q8L68_01525, partial [Methylococcales bacterium]|nr:hypothetical protein [Methylococcales bacterium]